MIISPPFLPRRGAAQTESNWLNAAMAPPAARVPDTRAAEGSFPLSHGLAWHNGMHIQAPASGTGHLPVRAIADGVIRFVHRPRPSNTTATDAQNYNPFDPSAAAVAKWTDNGLVVIEHSTSIGATGTTETQVVFFSVYMHLSSVAKNAAGQPWTSGDAIARKDEIGAPGKIYGAAGQIHFEVCLDDVNLNRMIGRAPAFVAPAIAPAVPAAPTEDGRLDSIFGSAYVYLPASTPTATAAAMPASHLRRTGAGTTLGTSVWVRMTYGHGNCQLETFDERGLRLGERREAGSVEYGLSREATSRHESLPPAEKLLSSASGWYELLRFGRNVGAGVAQRDRLPANAAHWRQILGPAGAAIWVDLNASGTFKFSDADFLPIQGWNFYDDDPDHANQLCESTHLKEAIRDPAIANTRRMEPDQLAARLGTAQVKALLLRAVCKFSSEWDASTTDQRYGFAENLLQEVTENTDAWTKLQAHLKAISFSGLPAEYLAAQWRFHPRQFVEHFSGIGWLSKNELGKIYTSTSEVIRETYRIAFNQVTRKYLYASSPLRLSHFLGQGAIESVSMRTMQEASMIGNLVGTDFYGTAINPASRVNESQLGHWYGSVPTEVDAWFGSTKYNSHQVRIASSYNWRNGNLGDPHATKYRGRGFKQLTGLINYSKYWVYRGWLEKDTFDDSWWTDPQYVARHPAQMTLRVPVVDDPQRATATEFNCIDTGGWYLGSERPNTLREIDADNPNIAVTVSEKAAEAAVSLAVTQAINGGDIQHADRLRETRAAKKILL
jgi:predicted chitinase